MTNTFRPTATWEVLQARAGILRRVRQFFETHGFLEVETPILSRDTVIDRHLDPFTSQFVPVAQQPERSERYYLQTSPEFAMKRLLAAGATAIFQLTKVFRNGEVGPLHNPEFTMLEWYRCGDDQAAGMRLLADFAAAIFAQGDPEAVTYGQAFSAATGLDPHIATVPQLQEFIRLRQIAAPDSLATMDRDGWLELIFGEVVEPGLGRERPTIIYDYPASQAALARVRPEDPPVAERFELYVHGVELANGYHELLDPTVLRTRNATNNRWRVADGKAALPEESRLLAAMDAGLPACTGVALGIDRLIMLVLGATTIAEVLAFPFERA